MIKAGVAVAALIKFVLVRLELLVHRVDQVQLSNLHERDLSHPRSATRQPP
jgi:hypothetical protein